MTQFDIKTALIEFLAEYGESSTDHLVDFLSDIADPATVRSVLRRMRWDGELLWSGFDGGMYRLADDD